MLPAQGLATRHDVRQRALPGALEAVSKRADYIYSRAGATVQGSSREEGDREVKFTQDPRDET